MRKSIKELFMRAYFENTKGNLTNHTWKNMVREGILKKDVAAQMETLRTAIIETCGGKIYGSEIFLAESCIYLRVLQRLLELGHKVWLLYDCFYCNCLDKDDKELNKIIDEYLRESFDEYILKFSPKAKK